MAVKCAWASISEKGTKNGVKGDQTKKEVKVGTYYSFGQKKVIRPKKDAFGKKIAKAAKALAENDNVGYGQNDRASSFQECERIGWDIDRINEIKLCNTDCSELYLISVNFAYGKKVLSSSLYTGNIANACKNTGDFDILTNFSESTLHAGDGVLAEGHHIICALENGAKSSSVNTSSTTSSASTGKASGKVTAASKCDKSLAGTYQVTASSLNIRTGAGKKNASLGTLAKGTKAVCYGYYSLDSDGTKWYYVVANKITGYCSSDYLKKVQ